MDRHNARYTSYFSVAEKRRRKAGNIVFVIISCILLAATCVIAVKFFDVTGDVALYESYVNSAKQDSEILKQKKTSIEQELATRNKEYDDLKKQYEELTGEVYQEPSEAEQ